MYLCLNNCLNNCLNDCLNVCYDKTYVITNYIIVGMWNVCYTNINSIIGTIQYFQTAHIVYYNTV